MFINLPTKYGIANLWQLIMFILIVRSTVETGVYITEQPRNVWTTEGSDITLRCCFSAPASQCYWRYDGIEIDVAEFPNYFFHHHQNRNSKNCSLSISGVSLARDDGYWQCYLPTMRAGEPATISSTARITVKVPPTRPQIEIADGVSVQTVQADLNSVLELSCITRHGNPATNLTWDTSGHAIEHQSVGCYKEPKTQALKTVSKIKLKVTKYLHMEKFICHSQYDNIHHTTSVMIHVTYPTTTVSVTPAHGIIGVPGDNVTLRCIANGIPPPHYRWSLKKKGTNIYHSVSDEPILKFVLSAINEGVYLCQAGRRNYPNDQPMPSRTVNVKLEVPPFNEELLNFVYALAPVSAAIFVTVFFLHRRYKRKHQAGQKSFGNSNLKETWNQIHSSTKAQKASPRCLGEKNYRNTTQDEHGYTLLLDSRRESEQSSIDMKEEDIYEGANQNDSIPDPPTSVLPTCSPARITKEPLPPPPSRPPLSRV